MSKTILQIIEEEKLEIGFFAITEDGHIIGNIDQSKLDALPWYKRMWAKLYRPYREKFTLITPIKIDNEKLL